ncbi:unnamed protein product [Calicophoron daubneyi]
MQTDIDRERNEDDNSSRYSSSSFSRVARSRCKHVPGEWCTHPECALSFSTRSRLSVVTEQRNTNNTVDTNSETDVSVPSTPSNRHRTSTRRSTRSSQKITTVTRRELSTPKPALVIEEPVVEDTSNRLTTSSSTYVYTYVPQTTTSSEPIIHPTSVHSGMGSAPPDNGDGPEMASDSKSWSERISSAWSRVSTKNNSATHSSGNEDSKLRTQGWLARHIFGLEKSGPSGAIDDDLSSQFVSSDIDEAEDQTECTSRRRIGRSRNRPPTSSSNRFLSSGEVTNHVIHSSQRGFHVVKRVFIEGIAFFLTCLYALSKLAVSLIQTGARVVRQGTLKLFETNEIGSVSAEDAYVHPRLSQFYGRQQSNTPINERSGLLDHFFKSTVCTFFQLFGSFLRLLGYLCIVIPFLLLLTFLFAPYTPEDIMAPSPILPPFLTDDDCRLSLLQSLPTDAGPLALAGWRFKCLYHQYFIDSVGISKNKHIPASLTAWWELVVSRFPRRSVPHIPLPEEKVFYDESTAGQLRKQLQQFSELVNHRLDLFERDLHSAGERISNVAGLSAARSKELKSQLLDLQSQVNTQIASMDLKLLPRSGTRLGRLNLTDPDVRLQVDLLVQATVESLNLTAASQYDLITSALMKKEQRQQLEPNDSGSLSLSLLLALLRQQTSRRLQHAEDEVARLRLQVNELLKAKGVNETVSPASAGQLSAQSEQFLSRLVRLEQLNTGSETLVKEIKEDIRQCAERQQLSDRNCRLLATERVDAAIANLSDRLNKQILESINEALSQRSGNASVDPALFAMIDHLIKQNIQLAVDRVTASSLGAQVDNLEDRSTIQQMIDASLQRFAADRTGMADFALESAGGAIIGTRCTRTYTDRAAVFSIFGISLARLSNSPRTILQPGNNPSDCWPFHGSTGQAVIRLSAPVIITAVTLEHLPRVLAPNGRIDSAPKEFTIKGLASEYDEEGTTLGNFIYDIDGPPVQTFPVLVSGHPYQYIEFAVLSNNGHPEYTCVYRLRVHGTMVEE